MNDVVQIGTPPFWRATAVGTAIAGMLDLAGAMVLSNAGGRGPLLMLQSIAGAVLGKATYTGGMSSALLGLLIHFAIMLVMVLVFVTLAAKIPSPLLSNPVVVGLFYGLTLYLVMYWFVLPLRWPSIFPVKDAQTIMGQLVCHVVLVGLPIALISASLLKSSGPR